MHMPELTAPWEPNIARDSAKRMSSSDDLVARSARALCGAHCAHALGFLVSGCDARAQDLAREDHGARSRAPSERASGGEYVLMAGRSSGDLPLRACFRVE